MAVNGLENSSLRPVTVADAKQLFIWANEAETRKNSFSSEPVLWENHVSWLDKKLADKNCLFFMMLLNDKPVGTIRLDIHTETKTGTISYSIDKNYRGMGLGAKILSLVEEKGKDAGLHYLAGEVKPENKASGKCFLKNDYVLIKESPEEIVYQKNID